MTISHPSPESLADYASGALKTGARLVLGIHLGACAHCRREVERLEAVGGALLAQADSADLAPDALDRALASIERPATPVPRLGLQDLMKGLWVPVGPGVALKPLRKIADPGERLFLIRAEGGRSMPEHGHTGVERLAVITGAFQDDQGRFDAGAVVERGPEHRHQPKACPGETCLCLSASDGPVRLSGVARVAQAILGI